MYQFVRANNIIFALTLIYHTVFPIYVIKIAVLFDIFVDHCTKDDVLCFIYSGIVTQNIKTSKHFDIKWLKWPKIV